MKPVEKQSKFIGRITPKRGHTLFKVNTTTGLVTKAIMEDTVQEDSTIKKRVKVEDGYFYISALNKKNVVKKMKAKSAQ